MHEWARRVAADWPALETVERGGWRLGRSDGVTKRANCALVLDPGADVDVVTDLYRGHGLTPCVQVWPGEEEVDARLARAGYRTVDPTLVLGRGLAERREGPGTTEIGSRPARGWSALTAGSEYQVRGIERILGQVAAGYGVAPRGRALLCGGRRGFSGDLLHGHRRRVPGSERGARCARGSARPGPRQGRPQRLPVCGRGQRPGARSCMRGPGSCR